MNRRVKTGLFFLLIVCGFGVRFYFSGNQGHYSDIYLQKSWALFAAEHGLGAVYVSGEVYTDYPPGYLYVLYVLGRVYIHWWHPVDPGPNDIPTELYKTPPIIFDVLSAILIFLIIKDLGLGERKAFLGLSIYLFNPAIIFDSAVWGQVETFPVFLTLLSIFMFTKNRFGLSWMIMAFAVLTKLWVGALIPLIFILTFRYHGLRKTLWGLAFFAVGALIVLTPHIMWGQLGKVASVMQGSTGGYDKISVNAYNMWRLMYSEDIEKKWVQAPSDKIEVLIPGVSAYHTGLMLFGLSYLLIALVILRKKTIDDIPLFLYCAVIFFAFFMFLTRMHERYIFPVFAFLAIASVRNMRILPVYAIASTVFFLNMLHVLSTDYAYIPTRVFWAKLVGEIYFLSYLNIVLFAYLLSIVFIGWRKTITFLIGLCIIAGIIWLVYVNQPAIQGNTGKVAYLSDFTPIYSFQEYKEHKNDLSVEGNSLVIANRYFKKGLGVHARSDIRYDISDIKGGLFQAWVGVDDEVDYGSVVFEVYVDGRNIYGSPLMGKGVGPEHVEVPVHGGKILRLVVSNGGEDGNYGDHADWGDAKIILGVVKPL